MLEDSAAVELSSKLRAELLDDDELCVVAVEDACVEDGCVELCIAALEAAELVPVLLLPVDEEVGPLLLVLLRLLGRLLLPDDDDEMGAHPVGTVTLTRTSTR